jgi:hypothetical protein
MHGMLFRPEGMKPSRRCVLESRTPSCAMKRGTGIAWPRPYNEQVVAVNVSSSMSESGVGAPAVMSRPRWMTRPE